MLDKSKIIISIMGVALIGTTTAAVANVNHIKNDTKGAKADMSITAQAETKVTKSDTTTKPKETTTSKNTTQAKTPTKKSSNNIVANEKNTKKATTEKNKVTKKNYTFNQSISSEDIKIDFETAKACISEDGTGEMTIVVSLNKSNKEGTIKVYNDRLKIVDNNGNNLNNNSKTFILATYDDSVVRFPDWLKIPIKSDTTSINISYTFDDGTVDSTVLNLK